MSTKHSNLILGTPKMDYHALLQERRGGHLIDLKTIYLNSLSFFVPTEKQCLHKQTLKQKCFVYKP